MLAVDGKVRRHKAQCLRSDLLEFKLVIALFPWAG